MLKNGRTYCKNFAVLTPQDFKSIFNHFSILYMKGLTVGLINIFLSHADSDLKKIFDISVTAVFKRHKNIKKILVPTL